MRGDGIDPDSFRLPPHSKLGEASSRSHFASAAWVEKAHIPLRGTFSVACLFQGVSLDDKPLGDKLDFIRAGLSNLSAHQTFFQRKRVLIRTLWMPSEP